MICLRVSSYSTIFLFKKRKDDFFWVGVNLFGTEELEERNVSIYAGDILEMDVHWYDCSPTGVSTALDEQYDIHVGTTD